MSDTWWPNWPCLKIRPRAIFSPIAMRFFVLSAADRPLYDCEESVWILLPVCLWRATAYDLFSKNAILTFLTLWPCWPEVEMKMENRAPSRHPTMFLVSKSEIRMLISLPVRPLSRRPVGENDFFGPMFKNSPKIHFRSVRPAVPAGHVGPQVLHADQIWWR